MSAIVCPIHNAHHHVSMQCPKCLGAQLRREVDPICGNCGHCPDCLLRQQDVGRKDDSEKPRWDLSQHRALARYVDVLSYGARKYSPDGWRSVSEPKARYYAAAMRHLNAWSRGERLDESALPHLAHAITSLMFLLELEEEGK